MLRLPVRRPEFTSLGSSVTRRRVRRWSRYRRSHRGLILESGSTGFKLRRGRRTRERMERSGAQRIRNSLWISATARPRSHP